MSSTESTTQPPLRLGDDVAVVTGGTAGIGLAVARRFAQNGAHVVITGRDRGRLDRAVSDVQRFSSEPVLGVRADSGDLADLDRLFAQVGETFGHVDVLYASAAIPGAPGTAATLTPVEFDSVVTVNLRGTFFTVQKALSLMPDGGRIVLGGSVAGGVAQAGASVYGATKAAVRALARSWAVELAPRRIRVNVVTIGPTDTPGMRTAVPGSDDREAIAARVPLDRLGEAAEQAAAALFLASDDSSFVTGAELVVDGGFTLM